ncbi:alanine racemase [Proteocatella sphenisci]|uniref:alanine racemase n=1 Tax=Proteocatella sphenisci TaxID=181070 RepID=UPI0004B4AC37|nr:alanine racemase [Proteocatella sphenisci]
MESNKYTNGCNRIVRDTCVKIDLSAMAGNIKNIKEMAGESVDVMAVIKADGYGHGSCSIAPALMEHGASYLGVATLSEALELRNTYSDYPIFILGHTPDRLLDLVVEKNITQTVFSLAQAEKLSEIAKKSGRSAKIHIKVDTGFHRLGTESVDEIVNICSLPNLDVEGIFSHLALAGDRENQLQYEKFTKIISQAESRGCSFRYKHIADSIACVDYPQYHMNMVRPGALLYGLKGYHKGSIDVRQALSFVSRISQIHDIPEGEGAGYDFIWKAPQDTRIATIPFGYADGYPRNMNKGGYVTIRGVKCPVIGIICMDQCMVDLTGLPDAEEGDLVIIYGDGSNNTMSIDEAAKIAQTNKNEIVSRISARPPRVYINI